MKDIEPKNSTPDIFVSMISLGARTQGHLEPVSHVLCDDFNFIVFYSDLQVHQENQQQDLAEYEFGRSIPEPVPFRRVGEHFQSIM